MNITQHVLLRMMPCFRAYSSNAFGHDNLKRMNLSKKVLTTLLFGGTLVAAIWSRKKRKIAEALRESQLLNTNQNYHSKLSLYNYRGYVMPEFVLKTLDEVKTFECREDDIFVVSFPKTGTTWLQEIVYCIMTDSKFSNEGIESRFPYLEFFYPGLSSIKKISGQRFIKSHLPYSLLPKDIHEKKPKILYMMRNPKDVTVSYYHFLRMLTMSSYSGSFCDFARDMLEDKVPYGPLWKHYSEIWTHRHDPNVLILFYEDLHKDIYGSIKKVAEFLGRNLTDEEVENIAVHCSFSEMASNPAVNYSYWDDLGMRNKTEAKFMRKGAVGDWKNYFTHDLNEDMNAWIQKHMGSSRMEFTYELRRNEKPEETAVLSI